MNDYYFHLGPMQFSRNLTGKESTITEGRWNREDTPCIYLSKYKSGCVLSIIDGLADDFSNLVFTTYQLPRHYSSKHFFPQDLPVGWDADWLLDVSRNFGSNNLSTNEYLVITLPPVFYPEEIHLLNTKHPQIQDVKIVGTQKFTPSSDGSAESILETLKKCIDDDNDKCFY